MFRANVRGMLGLGNLMKWNTNLLPSHFEMSTNTSWKLMVRILIAWTVGTVPMFPMYLRNFTKIFYLFINFRLLRLPPTAVWMNHERGPVSQPTAT
jgi:hypothetical protein